MRLQINCFIKHKIDSSYTFYFNKVLKEYILDNIKDNNYLNIIKKDQLENLFFISMILNRKEKSFQNFSFFVSSPINKMLKILVDIFLIRQIIEKNHIKIYMNDIFILHHNVTNSDGLKIKMLTPVISFEEMILADRNRRNYYYNPFEKEFSNKIRKELCRRWERIYNEKCEYEFTIQSLFRNKKNECTIKIKRDGKEEIIKGWKGEFILKGDMRLVKFAYDTGLGKNTELGFGMFEIIN